MMRYPAPDGHIIESLPYPQVVTYTCPCEGFSDGIYKSYETTGSLNRLGIQQIQITRTIQNNIVTISIIESTEEELQAYLDSLNLGQNNV
jgi:hypothetical protein